ncbi:E3 ubiquitin-protein ligase MYCBP2 [Portunus trituberculatus]|uniref:E3 ubiquitin-protein ligase MYCBP2 n=1 Tax=Portunus trituberculatus TaxID=210409 RepID=A0A5B7HYN0_PORTR|nr:E3 ubiquitin-protein ligase MYCBP2 [Portunus trituberculatus]
MTVIFYFKSSKKSNNGTDVNAGQIPQLLYRINTHEGSAPPKQLHDSVEPVPILSKSFYMTVRNVSYWSCLATNTGWVCLGFCSWCLCSVLVLL